MASSLEKVGPRDPNVCQGNLGTGRCHYKAAEGSPYCLMHGGGPGNAAHKRNELRNYKLQSALAQRAGELANSSHLKDLTDEIALTRLSLEGILKNISQPTDFVIYSDKISSLVKTVQSLVESTQKLQEKNKELLDRQTLMGITDNILSIIVEYVTDPEAKRLIGEKIYECIIEGMGEQVS